MDERFPAAKIQCRPTRGGAGSPGRYFGFRQEANLFATTIQNSVVTWTRSARYARARSLSRCDFGMRSKSGFARLLKSEEEQREKIKKGGKKVDLTDLTC